LKEFNNFRSRRGHLIGTGSRSASETAAVRRIFCENPGKADLCIRILGLERKRFSIIVPRLPTRVDIQPAFIDQGRLGAQRHVERIRIAVLLGLSDTDIDESKAKRRRDARGDLILQAEDIGVVAVEAVGPKLLTGLGVDQPRIDALLAHKHIGSFTWVA
jgi:hypothetical protein